MILAIGIAAIVLITISAALFSAVHLRNATVDLVNAESPVDSAVAFIERDLRCCVPPTNGTDNIMAGGFRAGSGVSSVATGEPVAVDMCTATGTLSDKAPWGDLQRVTYELRNSANPATQGGDLYRSVTRNLLSISTPQSQDQLMLSGVASIQFSCYDGQQWQSKWDTTDTSSLYTNLPLAVRVDIQMAGNSAAQPVEIVVPIDAQSPTNYVPDTTENMTGT